MKTVVAYLGPEGTFTESALLEFQRRGCFGPGDIAKLPVESPHEALNAVRSGAAQYACVAIENSVDGPVTHTFDALADGAGVRIFAETEIEISFSVMVRPGTSAGEVRTFTTHPVARQQVRNWTDRAFPDAEFVPASSNAAAAKAVAEGHADAAVAPHRAAEIFALDVIAENVIDVPGARTRFVVVGGIHTPPAPTGNDRTAVVFTLPNTPGALVSALTVFSSRDIDLSRIESRPTRTELGTYRFHVDIAGHIEDRKVAEAFQALGKIAEGLTYLGSWPVKPK
ncbi:prephenate dehydratase [Corynebacterium sp. CCM 9185]|uniref:Prephenate dehydratase n=1 Tax=Corynebacterium marambiense TaxID=2765364 RepID=A0ABS0W0R9_9CORY|nr:prephenate dehydratase [Corynebacterium marambiense]MBI9001182.1 prephenate dehydratase [Corynebacterium marambiense]MCK7663742.1 prephenate dehydratase [Corynebacterium marambiense]